MSTMKTNIAKREKSLMAAKAIGSLMAIAVFYKCGDTGR